MMKQPALGIKLSELRKARGLTQEELVERCNVSVRTIQRIEAGEVMPRSYTVRLLLAAMGYPFETVVPPAAPASAKNPGDEPDGSPGRTQFAQMSSVQNEQVVRATTGTPSLSDDATVYTAAMIGGLIYILAGSLEGVAEYLRAAENELLFGRTGYIVVKVIALLSYALFMCGFVRLGTRHNSLLRVASLFVVAVTLLIITYDIVSLYGDATERPFVMGASAVSAGAMAILFGIGVKGLDKYYGEVASLAGILEIVAGCCLVTVVLALPGLLLMLPAEILEILVLYRAIRLLRAGTERPAA